MRVLNREGEIDYQEDFLSTEEADRLFLALEATMNWHEEFIRMAGRSSRVPRSVAWHGDADAVYRYSGVRHEPRPWTTDLWALKSRLEAVCGQRFNSVLGNRYADGQDAMGWHADNEPELGPAPVIASLSLGAERRFDIRHNTSRKIRHLPLSHGSLLTMSGSFQFHWQHRIPRQTAITAPRINLTFRLIHPNT
jgi:alkylated DNA repair dioxygenase AlkB